MSLRIVDMDELLWRSGTMTQLARARAAKSQGLVERDRQLANALLGAVVDRHLGVALDTARGQLSLT
jgi:hypothetical protein